LKTGEVLCAEIIRSLSKIKVITNGRAVKSDRLIEAQALDEFDFGRITKVGAMDVKGVVSQSLRSVPRSELG
jgi:hypothetical protein